MAQIDDRGVVVTVVSDYSNQVGALISVMHAVVRGRVRAESPLGDLGLLFGAATSPRSIADENSASSCQLNDQHILVWSGKSLAAQSAGNLVASFIQGSVGRPVSRISVGNVETYRSLLGVEPDDVEPDDAEPDDTEPVPPPRGPSLYEVWVMKGWDCPEKRFQHILSMLLINPDEEQTSCMSRAARDFKGSISLNPKKIQLLLLIEMMLATFTALVLGIHPVLALMVGRRITRAHITSQKFASLSAALLGVQATIAPKQLYGIDIPTVAFELCTPGQPRSKFCLGARHIFVTVALLSLSIIVPTVAWTVRVWLPGKALSAFITPGSQTKALYLVISVLYSLILAVIAIALLLMPLGDCLLAESGYKPGNKELISEESEVEWTARQTKEFFRVKQWLVVWNLMHLLIAIPISAVRFSIHRGRISQVCNTLVGFLGLLSAFLYSTIAVQSTSCRLRAKMWDSYAAFASFAFMVLVFSA